MMNTDLVPVPERPTPRLDVLSRKRTAHAFADEERKRILLVDDDATVLGAILETLSWLGYEVVAGRNGIEGLARNRERPCEFVLTDLNMPVMDGLTLARQIKAEEPFIPVVIMTGNQTVKDKLSIQIQEGVIDGFLLKPFRLADLRETIQRLSVPDCARKQYVAPISI